MVVCHSIWVFTVCQSTHLGVTSIQRVNENLNRIQMLVMDYVFRMIRVKVNPWENCKDCSNLQTGRQEIDCKRVRSRNEKHSFNMHATNAQAA